MPQKDENETAAELVKKLTGSDDLNAEDMIADPETRRKFIEMKKREEERKAKLPKRACGSP